MQNYGTSSWSARRCQKFLQTVITTSSGYGLLETKASEIKSFTAEIWIPK